MSHICQVILDVAVVADEFISAQCYVSLFRLHLYYLLDTNSLFDTFSFFLLLFTQTLLPFAHNEVYLVT